MFLKKYIAIIFISLGWSLPTQAQNNYSVFKNLKTIKIAVQDSTILDTLSIEPNSLHINNIDSSTYHFYPYNSLIVWKKKPLQDSITITFRTLPNLFTKKYYHKKPNAISRYLGRNSTELFEMDATTSNNIVDFGNLDYSGSLSRGLNFGNSQDVVVNSQFNLQLNGMLGDSIEILANITDNNIPFQPEGNTQKLQEFDKVFIQFKKRNAKLLIGDFDILRPKSYFMNYYKRVQGVSFSNQQIINKNINYNYTVGASLAKGKFVRTTIATTEGNQGPYKITGPNGETFFIILANSEKLYIDGVLLKRGEDKDYIIDYNQAEITFMPRRMITKDTRLIIEYEINDKNYLNSLLFTNHEMQINPKLNVYFNAYSNQDAKNQSIQQTLDDKQKYLLSTIGDNISNALYPSYRVDTFSANKVMYKMVDTLVNGNLYDSIFVYSTNADSAKYTMGFSSVGANKGNYIINTNLQNGRVYSWVAPINNIPQGNYIPYIVLITPKRQQLFTTGFHYQINKNQEVQYEGALSNNDLNLFSKIDDNTHLGTAQKIDYTQNINLSKNSKWKMKNNFHYEFVQSRFRQLEPFRNAEFARDWTINFNANPLNENLGTAHFELDKETENHFVFESSTFLRGNEYKGFRNYFLNTYQKNNWRYNINGSITNSEFLGLRSNYYRPSAEVEKTFFKINSFTIGLKCSLENNLIKTIANDSIAKNSFAFKVLQLNIHNAFSAKNKWNATYFTRIDEQPDSFKLKNINQSHNFSLNANITTLKNQSLNITSTYRKLIVLDTTIYKLHPEDNLLGRIDYNLNMLHNGINYNMLYEFGSGQDLKREFTYVEVPIGQGNYYWIDYNKDGVQQLNEFELAQYPDQKKYIKVFTPTNIYVGSKYNSLNQSLSINMKQILGSDCKQGIKKFGSLFIFQSSMQIANKFLSETGIAQYNPFYNSKTDNNLLSNGTSINNSIYFNRFGIKWGLDFIQTYNKTRTLLTYGIDDRIAKENGLKLRWLINKQITFYNFAKTGNKIFNSAFLNNKSYNYLYNSIEPSINYLTKNNSKRFSLNYKIETRNNKISLGGENATINTFSTEFKNAIASSGSLNMKASLSNISFNGDANNSVGFIMLDGLQIGKNYIWNATYDKRLSKGIEISFSYEGRKPGTSPVVHTGRASVRAIF